MFGSGRAVGAREGDSAARAGDRAADLSPVKAPTQRFARAAKWLLIGAAAGTLAARATR